MFENDDPNSDMPATERIPSVLIRPWLGKGHILFVDNFYTSPALADYMLNIKTHLCGTVNPNRKNFALELNDLDLVLLYFVNHKMVKRC